MKTATTIRQADGARRLRVMRTEIALVAGYIHELADHSARRAHRQVRPDPVRSLRSGDEPRLALERC